MNWAQTLPSKWHVKNKLQSGSINKYLFIKATINIEPFQQPTRILLNCGGTDIDTIVISCSYKSFSLYYISYILFILSNLRNYIAIRFIFLWKTGWIYWYHWFNYVMYVNLKWFQFGNGRNANKYSREVTKSKTKDQSLHNSPK